MFEKIQQLAMLERFLKAFERFAMAHEAFAIEQKRKNNLLEASMTGELNDSGKPKVH